MRVAVAVNVKGSFLYSIPEHLESMARVGCRVFVPFGNRKVTGYVLEKGEGQGDHELKDISEVLDPEPLFHEQEVPFFEWMADYYLHPVGRVIQSVLPGGLNAAPFKSARLTEKGLSVLDRVPAGSQEDQLLSWIRDHPEGRLPCPREELRSLERQGWVVIREKSPRPRVGPVKRKFVKARKESELKALLRERTESLKAKDEAAFLQALCESDTLLMSDMRKRFPNGDYLLKKWVKRGLVETYESPVYRSPAGNILFSYPVPQQLHGQQVTAVEEIHRRAEKGEFSAFLLHGVTGSGKTEVYYRAAEKVIAKGGQVILMVPEIALAVYMEGVLRSRLGEKTAVYHSGLSRGERYDQWMRMARGEVDLVIGARSALFSPLPKLGMIIVDEEHEPTYKQEGSPRYQARDAAVMRGKMEGAVVILGSGTPSVQSFHNALSGRYRLLSMPERVEKRSLPEVEIVDMTAAGDGRPRSEMLSTRLREALEKNLNRGDQQTILFLNRRGFHRLYLCRSCGQVVRCPNCDVALIHHLKENRLSCHYCGHRSGTPGKCPSCGQGGLKAYGFGTEKLEQELEGLFPSARIERMDTDRIRRKGQAYEVLKRVSRHEVDILVGTQMITKGYDFPGVTLVGVIAADLSLGFPDFRAAERTFQLLSQAAGRSGRGKERGKVIIQSFNKDHYAILAATAHDYRAFFEKERELREQLSYPPFSHMALLRLQGNNKEKTEAGVRRLSSEIKGILRHWPKRGREIRVLGPVEAPISRLKGKYRWQVLVKCRRSFLLRHFLSEVERLTRRGLASEGVQMIMDVDPYQVL